MYECVVYNTGPYNCINSYKHIKKDLTISENTKLHCVHRYMYHMMYVCIWILLLLLYIDSSYSKWFNYYSSLILGNKTCVYNHTLLLWKMGHKNKAVEGWAWYRGLAITTHEQCQRTLQELKTR